MLLQRLIVTNTQTRKTISILEDKAYIFKTMKTFTETLHKTTLKVENTIEWEGPHDVYTLRLSFTPVLESQVIYLDVLLFFFSSEFYYKLFDIKYLSTPVLMAGSKEEKVIVFRVKGQENYAFVLKPKSQAFFATILSELEMFVRDKNDNIVIEVADNESIETEMKNVLNKLITLQNCYPNIISLSKEMLKLANEERCVYSFKDNTVYYTYDSLSLLEDVIVKTIEDGKVCIKFVNMDERNKLFTVIDFTKIADLLSILNDEQIDYEVHYRMPENGNTLTIHIYKTEIVDTVSNLMNKFEEKFNKPNHH